MVTFTYLTAAVVLGTSLVLALPNSQPFPSSTNDPDHPSRDWPVNVHTNIDFATPNVWPWPYDPPNGENRDWPVAVIESIISEILHKES
ncbi:hypothetical protein GGI03_008402 [Coemansia sp. RSA 2337]|nr:hypothetical protein IW146_010201 [Coemansia sp. RSA 922]KAJ2097933.1 hypothetical protein GGI16_004427 [Coemansia sp. S142-1]KAJ2339163.1 hypothetical protein GGH92_006843 [Coemansia sp. RSA 2673]KAJ2441384.1 hypothetical protein GGI03_008402 [Coemansia sp. RSA 2337]